ncbi:protein phosphatase 2C domain-containing protein [Planococcus sp. 1R117A]|uniref:protein phosphatase 2C domain-containing protein n=1 Tax=Planococcus sp. 1R117A TaxID=3447020 RepID=UPI003EDC094F
MKTIAGEISWVGSRESFIDRPNVLALEHAVVGRFGGNSSAGQVKNEDGCLVWINEQEDWEFVVVLDAHNTAESAEKVLEQVEANKGSIENLLNRQLTAEFFKSLEKTILDLFRNEDFRSICRSVQGETACLIAARKGKYIWWFSVGDCLLYLFHPELVNFGQYQLNQRQFYEWIGQVNTFEGPVPCYSSGTKELRQGENHLFITTDGLIECPGEPFGEPQAILVRFANVSNEQGVRNLLKAIQENGVRDSTTIVSWKVRVAEKAAMASNQA